MPKPGDLLLDRYRILDRLGSGGMATVDRARDERLDRDVAVKVLLPNLADDPPTAARFEREARSLAAAAHPGVVAVYDVDAGDRAAGREPFYVMELCPGGSLADRLVGGRRVAPDDLVPILVSVADGLADLHRRGVVHRDIKPQNVLFAADRAKLADFGLALADGVAGPSDLTTPGMAVGTLAYLAPEVLAGERATAAADVYGLGVMAFIGLTGRPPRAASSMAELVTMARAPASRVSAVAPDIGPAFDEIVAATLAVDPDDRPDPLAVASGLAAALGRWSRDGGPARWAGANGPELPRAAAAAAGAGPAGPAGAAAAAAAGAAGAAGAASVAAAGAAGAAGADPSDLVAVAREPAGDRTPADDETTALHVPLGATAAVPVGAPLLRGEPADRRPREPDREVASRTSRSDPARTSRSDPARTSRALVAAATVAVLVLAALAVLGALRGPAPTSGAAPSAPSAGPSIGGLSAPPSVGEPSAAAPSPTADPAVAALDALDAAIGAAKGGPDGLKGKDVNDLEAGVAAVRRALAGGDREAALEAARKLDRQIADRTKHLDRDAAARLRDASAALLRALGG